jgi:hypothetical protein
MSESGGTWTQYQKLVLKLLEQHDEKLESLRRQLADSEHDKTILEENFNSLKQDVDFLLTIVRDGSSGSISLLSRLESIDYEIRALKKCEEDRNSTQKSDKDNLVAWKRALFIAIMGILLNIGWGLVQTIYIGR